jgi:GTP-binding protein HflX
MVDNALFATLDPEVRNFELPGGGSAVLVDTVGFIRKLPHALIEAFRATLEESLLADLLVLVIDASSPWAKAQYQASIDVLKEAGLGNQQVILALNKIDCIADTSGVSLLFSNLHAGPVVMVSANTGLGCDELLTVIADTLHSRDKFVTVQLGHDDGKLLSWLYAKGSVLAREDLDQGPLLKLRLDDESNKRLTLAGLKLQVEAELIGGDEL